MEKLKSVPEKHCSPGRRHCPGDPEAAFARITTTTGGFLQIFIGNDKQG
jgi:hypothetical protein